MKSKEQILNECHERFVKEKGISSISTPSFPVTYMEQAKAAMDEWIIQVCIPFAIDYLKGALTHGKLPSEVATDRMDVRLKIFLDELSKQ